MIERPCQGICSFKSGTGFCDGCKMSVHEIRNWFELTEEQQKALTRELKTR